MYTHVLIDGEIDYHGQAAQREASGVRDARAAQRPSLTDADLLRRRLRIAAHAFDPQPVQRPTGEADVVEQPELHVPCAESWIAVLTHVIREPLFEGRRGAAPRAERVRLSRPAGSRGSIVSSTVSVTPRCATSRMTALANAHVRIGDAKSRYCATRSLSCSSYSFATCLRRAQSGRIVQPASGRDITATTGDIAEHSPIWYVLPGRSGRAAHGGTPVLNTRFAVGFDVCRAHLAAVWPTRSRTASHLVHGRGSCSGLHARGGASADRPDTRDDNPATSRAPGPTAREIASMPEQCTPRVTSAEEASKS